MARSTNNVVMKGVSGTIGKMLVFRTNAADKTIIARRPKQSNKPLTVGQLEVRERFTEAAYYAKSAIGNPVLKEQYQAKARPGQSAYNIAFADYLKAPALRKVMADEYMGQIGDKLTFRIIDNFKLQSVNVRILDEDNNVIEQGAVTPLENGLDWQYTATVANPTVLGTNLEVTVKDTPVMW
ncbi:hypothetical protein [Pedobacter sp. UBA4863]|uniref:hypothetical protein n=1 Tax=Pedobacter sp. UBA4863 TaxID=1947060 RepID=UPI0025D621B9|nr:hypothetical protein [Pedobacter sp. UBA4863]